MRSEPARSRPWLTFYGDDFTGASAVMEVLASSGLRCMLLLEAPDARMLADYPDLQAIGVAGVARSKSPAWMRHHLPPVFEALRALEAPVFHYKVCSTFDSAPQVGSIGAAAEIGAEIFAADWVPLVVGAPEIRRYQVFGTLFAAAGDAVYRLDRHPVMARHPATPMDEADLGRHLAAQTDLPVVVVDMVALKAGQGDVVRRAAVSQGARIVAIDALDDQTLAEAGRMIWRGGAEKVFAIGSQGVEYALVAHWRRTGELPDQPQTEVPDPVGQLLVVSGSCASITGDQIAAAETQGFAALSFDASQATDAGALAREESRVAAEVLGCLGAGRDVLVATARGPDDPARARMQDALRRSGCDPTLAHERLGQALGRLVAVVRRKTGLQRVVVAGGDTSGHALTALNAEALSIVAPLAPGAPLCRLHSRADPMIDGLEASLKGGQMGGPAFFTQAKG